MENGIFIIRTADLSRIIELDKTSNGHKASYFHLH